MSQEPASSRVAPSSALAAPISVTPPSAPVLQLSTTSTVSAPESRTHLTEWTPQRPSQHRCMPARQFPSSTSLTQKDQWLVRAHDTDADDLWISGNFINWRIPGLQMSRSLTGEWQIVLELTPGEYQFACYRLIPGCGFQRLVDHRIQCELVHQDQTIFPPKPNNFNEKLFTRAS